MHLGGERRLQSALEWAGFSRPCRRDAGATNPKGCSFLFILLFLPHIAFAAQRNLMLITIDTWRADYLRYNGSTKVQTPHLDRLAKEGVNFTRARTAVPLTLPSHTSIMTGLHPVHHGVRDNGSFRLSDSHSTLAKILKSKGYMTAAFVGSFVLDHRFGLNAGFDVYDDRTWNELTMLESPDAERNAAAVYKAFQSWWSTRDKSKPFFVWVHFYDPHAPYVPPPPFRAQYKSNPYAGEVAYADFFVGKLRNDLEKSNLMGDTLVAVVGDHGEGLGEHQENSHSVLIYNSTLHVPMILFAPGLVAAGSRVDSLTRTIDLAPTLLDYLGFEKTFGDGTSMRSVIAGGKPADVPSYSESLYPQLNLGWSPLFGVEEGKFHFILAPTPELYDLSGDATETRNRVKDFPQVAGELRDKLKPFAEKRSGPKQKLDPEAEEKLRSLGYVSGSPTQHQSNADPKEKMGVWNVMQQGMSFSKYGNCTRAVDIFEQVLSNEKDTPLIYDYLGTCYQTMQEWDKAEETYRKALDRGLESASARMNLGVLLQRKKRFEQAEVELRKAIQQNPLSAEAHYHLGNILRDQRKFSAALESYQESVRINPDYVYARNALGRTYSILNQDVQALENFRKAVEIDPTNAPAYFNLAIQLEKMGRRPQALESYRKFLALSSEKDHPVEREKAREAIRRLGGQTSQN